jgi:hypothetical protein
VSFGLYVHHDDAAREYAYDRNDKLQQFNTGWDEAVAKGWTVVSEGRLEGRLSSAEVVSSGVRT